MLIFLRYFSVHVFVLVRTFCVRYLETENTCAEKPFLQNEFGAKISNVKLSVLLHGTCSQKFLSYFSARRLFPSLVDALEVVWKLAADGREKTACENWQKILGRKNIA